MLHGDELPGSKGSDIALASEIVHGKCKVLPFPHSPPGLPVTAEK